jgi:hypothetical protein
VAPLCEFCPGICLTTEEKAWTNLSQGKENLSQVKKNLGQSKKTSVRVINLIYQCISMKGNKQGRKGRVYKNRKK